MNNDQTNDLNNKLINDELINNELINNELINNELINNEIINDDQNNKIINKHIYQNNIYDKKLYCINCGKNGHLTKNCLCPIISVGIICVKINILHVELNEMISYIKKIQNKYLFTSDEIIKLKKIKKKIDNLDVDSLHHHIEYLLIRRKNSLHYIEIIRGKYDINNLDNLQKNMNFITEDEKKILLHVDFDILWENLWGKIKTSNIEYIESSQKFNLLKKGFYIKKNEINIFISFEKLIKDSYLHFTEPEWGFPKGRRNFREKNIDCANREFEEETGIKSTMITIVNMTPLEELYLATNHLKYKHIYYIGQIKNKDHVIQLDTENMNQMMEIGDIKWLQYEQAVNIIREYNIEKKNILFNLHTNIIYIVENLKKSLEIYFHNYY